ncbi:MAG TPA: VanZ family protein [Herpetosiphonaceae bacterium]
MRRSALLAALLAGWCLLLLALALWPTQAPGIRLINLVPLRGVLASLRAGGLATLINVAGNVVAFLPLGLLPAALHPRWRSARAALLIGLGFSLAIELGQLAFSRRVTDVDDLILNALGALAGYGCYRLLSRLVGSQSGRARAASQMH